MYCNKIYVTRCFFIYSVEKEWQNSLSKILLSIPLEENAYPSHATIANFRWSFDEFAGI